LINRARNIIGPPLNVNYLQKSDWFSYPYAGIGPLLKKAGLELPTFLVIGISSTMLALGPDLRTK
jgi:hypothetical protein